MVSYANMKLKINNQIKTLDWNGQKIEIKEYLPIEDKYDLIMVALQKSLEDGYYNPIKLDMYFHLYLIYMTTNISFTEKQKEDEFKIYDTLKSNGFIDAFLENFNEDEYDDLYNFLVDTQNALETYKQSTVSLIQSLINDLPKQAEAMKDIMDNFNPEKYQEVINFAKAANGNRNV